MIKFSIGQKIFVGFLVLIALSASFLFISFPSLTNINVLSSMVVPLSKEMDVLQKYTEKVKQLENKVELCLTIRSEESSEDVVTAIRLMNELIDKVRKEKELKGVDEISGLMVELGRSTEDLLKYMSDVESTYKINLQILKVNKLFEKFGQVQETLQRQGLEELQKIVSRQKAIVDTVLGRFKLIEFSIIAFGFLASFFLSKLITRHLSKLRKATQEIAAGNFETHIDISAKDEIGELANSFNSMAEDLRRKTVSKEYVDNIIRSMAESLVVANSDLVISSTNKATCNLLGYSEEELVGKSLMSIISTEGLPFQVVDLKRLIREGRLVNYEINYKTKGQQNIPILFSVVVMKDRENKPICVICTARDITERKLAEEKLREVIEIKTRLTTMVSHELRTPLAAIKTGIGLILDGLAGEINLEQKDFLNIVKRNVDRLTRLINDVLDFHKLDSKKMLFKMQEHDINETIREIHKIMDSLAREKGLNFVLNLADNLPKVKFDKDRIIQVMENLVNNAIKFTKEGKIEISTAQKGKNIQVKVSDTGIGLRTEDLTKIFYSFEQLQQGRSGKIEGTGLGLAICKEIIEQHKGKIWAESEGENKGSAFILILPL